MTTTRDVNSRLPTLIAGIFALGGGLAAAAMKWGYFRVTLDNRMWAWPDGRYGSDFPEGGIIGVIYLFLILYLVATDPLRPPPVWRPLGTALFAVAAGIVFLFYGYGPGLNWVNFAGPWISLLSSLAVLITATFEMRGVLARQQAARAANA
jgi:hypothetical protein